MGITTNLINNKSQVERELKDAIEVALEAIGQQAESHAKSNITSAGRVDTGQLRNSIAHEVRKSEDAVYIAVILTVPRITGCDRSVDPHAV